MIPADDMAHIAAEVARGTSKEDSAWANLSPQHSAWWDAEVSVQATMEKHGIAPDIAHEAVEPLMNDGYDMVEKAKPEDPSPETPPTSPADSVPSAPAPEAPA